MFLNKPHRQTNALLLSRQETIPLNLIASNEANMIRQFQNHHSNLKKISTIENTLANLKLGSL